MIWKLLGAGSIVQEGKVCKIHNASDYAAPEIIKAVEEGSEIPLRTSADMWSFGAVYLEAFTGKGLFEVNLHRHSNSSSRLGELSLTGIDHLVGHSRSLVSSLLSFEAKSRPSAKETLTHPAFCVVVGDEQSSLELREEDRRVHEMFVFGITEAMGRNKAQISLPDAVESTDAFAKGTPREDLRAVVREETESESQQYKDELKQLEERLMEEFQKVKSTIDATKDSLKTAIDAALSDERCSERLVATFNMELLISANNNYLSLCDREAREVTTMTDDYVKEEPIFLINHEEEYRLRVSLGHKNRCDAARFRIKYILVEEPDGNELGLLVTETKEPSKGSEVIAAFKPSHFQSLMLRSGCSRWGSVEEKYVRMKVTIGIDVTANKAQGTNRITELSGTIVCYPISKFNPIPRMQRFKREATRFWRESPQWIKDTMRGGAIALRMAS